MLLPTVTETPAVGVKTLRDFAVLMGEEDGEGGAATQPNFQSLVVQ